MPLKIPVVFDPTSRLVVEDPSGANHPFEAFADANLSAGDLVYVYNNVGVSTIGLADASTNHPATGFVLEDVLLGAIAAVYTTGMDKQLPLSQGNGAGGTYTFTAADIGSTVYLDNNLPGKLTVVLPSTPKYQRVGEVIGVTTTNLEILFRPTINVAQDTLLYKGTWNASTNVPSLSSPPPVGSTGWYYIVAVSGTTNLGGISSWNAGDWVLSDGLVWGRVQSTTQLQLTSTEVPASVGATGAAIGVSADAAHADHTHIVEAATLQTLLATSGLPLPNGATGVLGDSVFAAHANHVHPRGTIKTPIRYYFESPILTTDKQPAMRIDGPSSLGAIRYTSTTPGTGSITVKIGGTVIATLGLSAGDTPGTFILHPTLTLPAAYPLALTTGDVVTVTVLGSGSAAGVTVQLDISQSV